MSSTSESSSARFILRFVGEGDPAGDIARFRSSPGLTIVDESVQRMLLVEASPTLLRGLLEASPAWEATPETFVPLPDVRAKIRRRSGGRG